METREPIGVRLRQVIEYYGLNRTSFSAKIGMTNNVTVIRIINDADSGISFDVLQKIGKTYPEISMDWLVMGVGRMLKDASAGSSIMFNISYFHNRSPVATDYLHLTGYDDCDMAFDDLVGDAMTPKIITGDIILCRTTSMDQLVFGEAYRIVTENGIILIRYLVSVTEDKLILGTENIRYREQEIIKSDISKIFAVKGIIRRIAY